MALCRSIRCSSVHGDLGIRLIWSLPSLHLKERSPRQNWSCLWKFRCWALPSNGFSNDHWALKTVLTLPFATGGVSSAFWLPKTLWRLIWQLLSLHLYRGVHPTRWFCLRSPQDLHPMVFVGTIGRCPEKLTPFLGGRGVSSAFDGWLDLAKQNHWDAWSSCCDCCHSRSGCWKPSAVFTFTDGQQD